MIKGKGRKILITLLLGVFLFNVSSSIYSNRDKFLTRKYWENFPKLEKSYKESQYVNKNPKGWIPDEVVDSYAGGAYVTGTSPIIVIPDSPPLGKYMIGLSALIFNNEKEIILLFYLLSFGALFILGKQIFKSTLISLFPLAFLSAEPILRNQIKYMPLLDLFQLVFIVFSFYFFNKGLSKKPLTFFMISNVFLGLFISTKFFVTGFTVIIAYYLVLLIRQKRKIFAYTLTLPIAPIILAASYLKVFLLGESIRGFLGIQKWIFLYHQSKIILPFSIWPLLLFNQWYVWWGNDPIIQDPQWRITWPIVTIITVISVVLYVLKEIRHDQNIEVLMAWSIVYLLFFSFGSISSRYFIILIPVLYLISTYGIKELSLKFIKNKRK